MVLRLMTNVIQNSRSTRAIANCIINVILVLCINGLLGLEANAQLSSKDLRGFVIRSVGPRIQYGSVKSIDFDLDLPYNIFGAMAEAGFWRGPVDIWRQEGSTGDSWDRLGAGHGSAIVTNWSNPENSYLVYANGGMGLSNRENGIIKRIDPWAPEGVSLRHATNPPVSVDRQDFSLVYYGSQFVHKSVNGGVSWQIISGDLTNGVLSNGQIESSSPSHLSESGPAITNLVVDPHDSEVIWVATEDGNLYITRSGGGQWENKKSRIRGLPRASRVSHVHVSAVSAGTAFVVFESLESSDNQNTYIYTTEDYGNRWDRISENRDIAGPVNTLIQDSVAEDLLFAGAEDGLYVSLNRGEDWIKWSDNLPAVPVQSLVVHPREHDLILGTDGRSVLVLENLIPLREMVNNPQISRLEMFAFQQNAAYIHVDRSTVEWSSQRDLPHNGGPSPYGSSFYYWINNPQSTSPVSIEILDFDNKIIRTVLDYPRKGVNHFVWDLREDLPEYLRGIEERERRSRFQGAEVLPGSYMVRVKQDLRIVEQRVEILADPRDELPLVERITKYQAMKKYLTIEEKITKMEIWVDRVRQGISETIEYLAEESASTELEKLKSDALVMRDKLLQISDFAEVYQYREQVGNMSSSYDAPTEGQRLDLLRIEEASEALFQRLEAFSYLDLGPYTERLKAAGVGPLFFLGFMSIG